MKTLLYLLFLFSLPALATEELCEEQTHVFSGTDEKFFAELSLKHKVDQVEQPSLILRQFEIEVTTRNGIPSFVINTPVPVRASGAESIALTRILSQLKIPSDGIGGRHPRTSLWIVQNNGQPDLGEWYVNYTCYESEESSVIIQDDRSSGQKENITPARLPYEPLGASDS